MGVLTYPKS